MDGTRDSVLDWAKSSLRLCQLGLRESPLIRRRTQSSIETFAGHSSGGSPMGSSTESSKARSSSWHVSMRNATRESGGSAGDG